MKIFLVFMGLFVAQNAMCILCEETITEFELDEVTPLGFSGRHLLNLAEGERPIKIGYSSGKFKPVSGRLIFRENGGKAKYRKMVDPRGTPEGNSPSNERPLCNDQLSVSAHVNFISDDGIFNESWDVELGSEEYGYNTFEGDWIDAGEYVNFHRPLFESDFSGDFRHHIPSTWQSGGLFGQIVANNYFAQVSHIYRDDSGIAFYWDAIAEKP